MNNYGKGTVKKRLASMAALMRRHVPRLHIGGRRIEGSRDSGPSADLFGLLLNVHNTPSFPTVNKDVGNGTSGHIVMYR